MDTVKITDKKHTKMVAHRGVSGIERENTLPSFIAAGNRSYFGIECDVHITKDKKHIVYHDDSTKRLCDKDIVLEESDFATIRALKVKGSGSEKFSETLVLPTLKEYLEVTARYDKVAVIELKRPMEKDDVKAIIEDCCEVYDLNRIIFISFDYDNLVYVREFLPDQKVQYLCWDYTEDLIEKLLKYSMGLDIWYGALTKERVDILHRNGIEINCYTCDDPTDAQKLIEWGVDMITSNILE